MKAPMNSELSNDLLHSTLAMHVDLVSSITHAHNTHKHSLSLFEQILTETVALYLVTSYLHRVLKFHGGW